MPYLNYDDAVGLVDRALAELGIEKGLYSEDPVIIPGVTWYQQMLKVEQCGMKDGILFVVQLFFELAGYANMFGRFTRVSKDGCNVNRLADLAIMASRPDFVSDDSEVVQMDLGGFAVDVHRRMPKSITTRLKIQKQYDADSIYKWVFRALSEANDNLLKSAAMYTLLSAVVDSDAAELISEQERETNPEDTSEVTNV